MENQATVIGAGLAGCEAAWQLAQAGVEVTLVEMKPIRFSPAHHSAGFAELVCSNSLKAERLASAAGLLKAEMQALGSLCVACAYESRVPAGGALAVDREQFSRLVTEQICAHARITVEHREATAIPKQGVTVIAAGPLASDALAGEIAALCGEALSFFDAAAPIVSADSVDMDCAFTQSRYGRGGEDDYINCPMDKEEYEAFYDALLHAESAPLHTFDKKKGVYEGCMPIEVMASRGADTMRFGPLKPVGLRDPRTGHRPWAVLQLRKENAGGTMYNLVGFQTNLKFGEQKRVFSMIPALHDAEFVRYGVMHRNTYLRSPGMLDRYYRLIADDRIAFAGQMTGVEGYIESAASGFLAGIEMARRLEGKPPVDFPRETAIGALGLYISDTTVSDFQPMNVNFGIMPPLGYRIKGGKRVKNAQLAARSLEKIDAMREDVLRDRKGE